MKHSLHIAALAVAFLLTNAYPAASKPRAYLLGGGHTNMSGRQWHLDPNGLRSGTVGYVHNLVGLYVDGSYSGLYSNVPNAHLLPGGYGIGGGLCYEHQRGMFKLQLGIGLRYQDVSNRVNDTTIIDNQVTDSRGYNYALKYDFQERIDRAYNLHAQVPILLGLGIRRFYFLTGVKLNYTFKGSSSVRQIGTTTGTYQQFQGQFSEMDNHGMRNKVDMFSRTDQVDFKSDILFAFETGYEWGDDIHPNRSSRFARTNNYVEYRLRVAAFVDYGLINICPQTDKNFLHIPPPDFGGF